MVSHVNVVSLPSAGHINPTLALVAELVRRGHRVTYATGEAYRAVIEGVGAEFVATPFPAVLPPQNGELSEEQMQQRIDMFDKGVRDVYPFLVDTFTDDRPAVILGDALTPVSALVAEQLDVPLVGLYPSYASNEHFDLLANDTTQTPSVLVTMMRGLVRGIHDFAAEQGLQSRPAMFSLETDHNFVLIPRSFQYAGDTFDDRFLFLGPSVSPRRGHGSWRPKDADRPVLLISLGTVFNSDLEFFRTCVAAFADSRWQVVMSIGENVALDELGTLPANFEVHTHVPQLDVLAHADLFLTHNGMNSTMEALYFGVPMVGVPQMLEQEFNADRVEELQYGRRLREDVSVQSLQTAVESVRTNTDITNAVAAMSSQLRSVNGAQRGADEVEKLIAT